MIRFATYDDIPVLVQMLHKFCEAPPYADRSFSPDWITAALIGAIQRDDFDLIVCEVESVIAGVACASQQPTLLCPENEYHEQFICTVHPAATRSLIRWIIKRGKDRKCFRTVIGSIVRNARYERMLCKAIGLEHYGKTFIKEYNDA